MQLDFTVQGEPAHLCFGFPETNPGHRGGTGTSYRGKAHGLGYIKDEVDVEVFVAGMCKRSCKCARSKHFF